MSNAYNIGYADGKTGIAWNLDKGWADDDVRWYHQGWIRGDTVRKSLEGRLYQKELFDE